MAVEFRLLGDVEADIDGELVDIGHARQRCVLVTLLVEANHVVPGTLLVDRVWGEHKLPARPANALQTYVALLRRTLTRSGEVRIDWRAPGYQLTVDPKTVDLLRFRKLIEAARACADDERGAELREQALGLWRGEPFGTLDTGWLNLVRATLAKERHGVRLDLTDIRLRLGQHAALLPGLAEQAAEHPLDERVAAQLITANYRSGRKADALAHYQQVRRRLADELGIDPGPPLQALHQRVLTDDPALAPPVPALSVRRPSRSVVPQQLPAPAPHFVGRTRELDRLSDALGSQGVVVISAISGAGGIGKSWLALHWAHRNRDRFPDGQLFVNLRGFDPSADPMPADVAVRGFLVALGVDGDSIPIDPDARTALYRSLVAGKRMLIVLDNALDSRHVDALLPGSPTCTVLVTSRRHLAGLATTHGAHLVELDVLPEHEADELLRAHLGAKRTTAEPEATAELLAACAGLPLALGIVAVRAARNPSFPLASLAGELRRSAVRLDALEGGDLAASVRAVLSWSRTALDTEAAALFALLGFASGPDFSVPAAASLAGQPASRVRALLRDLENAHLVQQHQPGRYRMHDLIRLYAVERAEQDLPKKFRCTALARLGDFYVYTAAAGERLLDPHADLIALDDPMPGTQPLPLPDQRSAMAWFDSEHLCLLAAQRRGMKLDWRTAWQMPWALSAFHSRRGYLRQELDCWLVGLAAAEQSGKPDIQAVAHRRLGVAYARMGQRREGIEHLNRALALAEQSGDLRCQAHTQLAFGSLLADAGDDVSALHHLIQAARLFLGTPVHEAYARNAVARQLARLGHYLLALAQCETARTLLRDPDATPALANTLDSLRFVAQHQGRYDQAISYGREARAMYRATGQTFEETSALVHLATAHTALGQHDQAWPYWRQAHDLYRDQHPNADADRAAWVAGVLARPGVPHEHTHASA